MIRCIAFLSWNNHYWLRPDWSLVLVVVSIVLLAEVPNVMAWKQGSLCTHCSTQACPARKRSLLWIRRTQVFLNRELVGASHSILTSHWSRISLVFLSSEACVITHCVCLCCCGVQWIDFLIAIPKLTWNSSSILEFSVTANRITCAMCKLW